MVWLLFFLKQATALQVFKETVRQLEVMNSCGVYFYILILGPSAKGGFPLGRHNCVQWLLHNIVRQISLTGTKQFSVADMYLWQGRCTDT